MATNQSLFARVFYLLIFVTFISCSAKHTTIPTPKVEPPHAETLPTEVQKPKKAATPKSILITGVGDIMLGTHFPSTDYLPPDDGISLLADVTPILKDSDITFGNLEGSLLDEGEILKKCSDPQKCYAFKMPERYVKHLADAGFNVLSIANNHIGDFGENGRERTIQLLTENNIQTAGVSTKPFTIFKKGNTTFGFCAFSPNAGIPDLRDIESAVRTVQHLAKQTDIVIVSFHGGAEGAENRHVTRKTETFYGENRGNVFEFSHRLIDAGADVVFGHGPHITRAVELYNDRFIAYSLGNFCTYARFNLRGHNGIAPIIKIKTDTTGKFLSGRIIPIIQEYKKGPAVDPQRRAIHEIIELTTADFPETNLVISNDGYMIKKTNN